MKITSKFTVVVLCLLSLFTASVSAQKQSNYYLWANSTYNNIGGDFNGTGMYEVDGYRAVIPEYNPAVGWEVGIGLSKGKHRLNVALGYTKFNDVTFENDGTLRWIKEIKDAYLGYYEANYAYLFLDVSRFNLYGVVGMGFNTKSANEAVEAFFATGITKYEAPHFNFGIDAEYYISKRMYVHSSVLYKLCNNDIVEISSASIKQYRIESLNGSWLSLNLGLGFKFGAID